MIPVSPEGGVVSPNSGLRDDEVPVVLKFPGPQQRASKARDVFPPLETQESIDRRSAREKIRGKLRFAWACFRTVCFTLGLLALLGFILGG